MTTVPIKQFYKGIKNDPRSNAFRTITNFDVFTDKQRALPYYDSENGDSGASSNKIQNFCIGLGAGSVWQMFGLGVDTGAIAQVFVKEGLTTGGANDLDDAGWGETANNASSSGTCAFNLFVYYKKTGYIYGARSSRYIWRYDPTGSGAWADTHHDLTAFTNIAQGLVHPKDDILYIPYDNKIATNDNGSWTSAALTLPTDVYITSICAYGNYLAIAAAPLSGIGSSTVYLWDRNSSLTTLSESINWGEGVIKVLEELEGNLIGISAQTDSTRTTKRITFRYWNGVSAVKFEEFTSSAATLNIAKQKVNNRIYFMLQITLNGVVREGVWSVTKDDQNLVVTHERTPNNDTPMSSGVLNNFFLVGDFMYISYQTGSAYALSKTNDTASYTHTSVIETAINPNMPEDHLPLKKQLYTVAITHDPLPSGGQIVVKYKADGGSWVNVLTANTEGDVAHETSRAVTEHFSEAREYEFKLEATGGAAPTALYYKYDPLETLL